MQNNDVNVRLKLEDVTTSDTVELTSVTGSDKANQWQTISWDFSSVDQTITRPMTRPLCTSTLVNASRRSTTSLMMSSFMALLLAQNHRQCEANGMKKIKTIVGDIGGTNCRLANVIRPTVTIEDNTNHSRKRLQFPGRYHPKI